MTSTLTDPAAGKALAYAHAFGWTIPPEITAAEKLQQEIAAVLAEPVAPLPALPENPKQIRPALKDAVAARAGHADRVAIAEQWHRDAGNLLVDLVRQAAHGWTTELAADFAKHVGELRAAVEHVPLDSNPAYLGIDQLTDWHRGTNLVGALEQSIQIRRDLAEVLREGVDVEPNAPRIGLSFVRLQGALPYCAALKLPDVAGTGKEIQDELVSHQAALLAAINAEPPARWQAWLAAAAEGWLHLSMPGPGELPARRQLLAGLASAGLMLLNSDGGQEVDALLTNADQLYRDMATVR